MRRAVPSKVLASVSLLLLVGCKASFDVAPQDASKIFPGNELQDHEGAPAVVPSEFEARVELWRDGEYRAMVPEEGGEPVVAEVVADDEVRAARSRGLTDRDVLLMTPVEGGIAPLGQGVAQSRGAASAPSTAPPGLWIRRQDGRLLEIPLDYVDTIHVHEEGMPPGAMVAIVAGSVLGAVALVATAVALARADVPCPGCND